MLSQQPLWLKSVLEDDSAAARLFAWGIDNLSTAAHQSQRAKPLVDESRRIYILGVGNLGRLFASSLASAPEPPPITLVVHKQELLDQWLHGPGVEIARSDGSVSRNKNFDVEWWTESPPSNGPVREVALGRKLNNLVIATKASAALPSADRVRRYLNQQSTVAFVQNGMPKLWPPHGPTYASHRFPRGDTPNFLSCVVTHGVYSQGPFSSVHASEAGAAIGPVLVNSATAEASRYLMQQVSAAPRLNSIVVSRADLWIRQLEKLVINSVINPLTAVLRTRNGSLFINPHPGIERVMDWLLEEASRVLQALIAHEASNSILTSSRGAREEDRYSGAIREALLRRFSQPRLAALLRQVGIAVKDNKSSMLQDVEAAKTTEIRDFNGWLADMAVFLHDDLHVPTHQKLIQLVEGRAVMGADELCRQLLGD